MKTPRGLMGERKITIAPQDKVEDFQYELEEILEVMGHPEALITDLSSIRDFISGDPEEADASMAKQSRSGGGKYGCNGTDNQQRSEQNNSGNR